MRLMDSRRLVVWISTGILGFQGATLAFDLLNCTALSWLVLRVNGLPRLERQQKHQPSAAERGLVLDPDAQGFQDLCRGLNPQDSQAER